jgi:hypothetical protein
MHCEEVATVTSMTAITVRKFSLSSWFFTSFQIVVPIKSWNESHLPPISPIYFCVRAEHNLKHCHFQCTSETDSTTTTQPSLFLLHTKHTYLGATKLRP